MLNEGVRSPTARLSSNPSFSDLSSHNMLLTTLVSLLVALLLLLYILSSIGPDALLLNIDSRREELSCSCSCRFCCSTSLREGNTDDNEILFLTVECSFGQSLFPPKSTSSLLFSWRGSDGQQMYALSSFEWSLVLWLWLLLLQLLLLLQ